MDVIHAGRVEQPSEVAEWYRAADLCVHPARADTFPNVVLESLACGTPVVATSVGGIPEQIHDVDNHVFSTGALVPAGDSGAMSFAIRRLLEDDALRARLGANAAADARARFDLERQVDRYIDLYTRLQREHPRPR